MATEVILPKLGQTMEEGTILEWLKSEGDPVQRGEVLFTTESDKATLEVEAPGKGFLRKILVKEGETVPVLTIVGLVTRTADEDISSFDKGVLVAGAVESTPEQKKESKGERSQDFTELGQMQGERRVFSSPRARKLAREKDVDLSLVKGTGPNGRIAERDVIAYLESQPKVTPVARKTADVLGVDITTITGTGAGGRITRADVEAAAQPSAPAAIAPERELGEEATPETIPVTGLRRIIGERMASSAHTTAAVTLVSEVDATAFANTREQLKEKVADEWGFAPSYNDILAMIVARVLRDYPYMNARFAPDGGAIEHLNEINVGIAVDTDRGLLVPVIRNADRKGLRALGSEFRELMERARSGKALPDDLTGGTFTITNLGVYEIDAFTPIINLPETAILGVGRIQAKPVARDGEVVIRRMVSLSLTFDHRLVDGAPAARFLQRIKQLVESPFLLLT